MRRKYTYAISNEKFIEQLLFWSEKFQESSLLISNNNSENFDALVAVGCVKSISPTEKSFLELKLFHDENKDWMFGYLSYDLKNEVENFQTRGKNNFWKDVEGCHYLDQSMYVDIKTWLIDDILYK